MSQQTQAKMDMPGLINGMLVEGRTLREIKSITDDEINTIYAVAHQLYEHGKYEKAHDIFSYLCLLDHKEPRYFLGMGACRQLCNQHEQALAAYGHAAILHPYDPRPSYHAGECLIALNRPTEALEALKATMILCKDSDKVPIGRVRSLIQGCSKKQTEQEHG